MPSRDPEYVKWQLDTVSSPGLDEPIAVIAARDLPYIPDANRFQNLSIYLPLTATTATLVGTSAVALPRADDARALPQYLVHVHGGAWRDPYLTSSSVEAAVAHTYAMDRPNLEAIISVNYTISQYPTHPTAPYDAIKDNHTDPAREGAHPQQVSDALHALALLRSFGLADDAYVLSGHSAGACLSFQTILQSPAHYDLGYLDEAPCPAAIVGLNGLYDLPALVDGLDEAHQHLSADYDMFLSNTFGPDKSAWPAASPALFPVGDIADRVRAGRSPKVVLLDESIDDQLVPMNQRDSMAAHLGQVDGMAVVDGHRCEGEHAAPWEQGYMIADSVSDVLDVLSNGS